MSLATPPPPLSYSTTCQVISLPASTNYLTYTSGQVGIFPETTYTAATISTFIHSATIEAKCFSLSPGATLPSTVPFVGVTCTTASYSAETRTGTVTVGETNPLIPGYTATSAATYIYTDESYTYLSCDYLPDHLNPATCDTVTPLTWASLVITFVTIQLSWWILDIPLLFKPGPPRLTSRLLAFFDAVTWSCVRANAPGSAGMIAFSRGRDVSEFARVYYMGMRPGEATTLRNFSRWKLATSLGSDLLSIVATGVTVYQACTLPEFDSRRFGLSMWAYPSLPAAVIGLCLLCGWGVFPRTKWANFGVLVLTVGMLVLVGLAVALVLWKSDTVDDLWYFSVILYAVMAIPAVLVLPLLPISILYGTFARVFGVGIASLGHYAGGQPWCKMPGVGFGATYLTLGVVSGLLGLLGAVYHFPWKGFFYRAWMGRMCGLRFRGMGHARRSRGLGEYVPKGGDPSYVQ